MLPAAAQPSAPPPRGSWFDPTQLPSFTGTVERWLINPAGAYDRMLFREGAQVVFPPHVSEPMREAAPAGQAITIWGVRARGAPVVTMLAWSTSPDREPSFVDRPAWFTPTDARGTEQLQVSGTVRVPLFSPQGDVIGAILTDGSVLRMSAEAADGRITAGRKIAASGIGSRRDDMVALDVERIGPDPDKLEPLPAPRIERRP
ncbi:hypothetical protein C8P66_11052 [Humitalea rosea]|uniref:Uncharacterized protein n=1 Tax=Humitalea rosea TaxID=990373 RepID=A0A2W7IGS2_9PROT|nr:hypothetical protein [Humitalea rosea]PZW45854.1 hypothetical protein C8P66_11052 [Humitalea rosea]